MVVILSSLSCAPRVVMVKAMVAVAMTEVSFVLLGLERGNIGGEKVGDNRGWDRWSKRIGLQRLRGDRVYRNQTQSLGEFRNGNGRGG